MELVALEAERLPVAHLASSPHRTATGLTLSRQVDDRSPSTPRCTLPSDTDDSARRSSTPRSGSRQDRSRRTRSSVPRPCVGRGRGRAGRRGGRGRVPPWVVGVVMRSAVPAAP